MSDIQPARTMGDYDISCAMFGAFKTSGGLQFFLKLTAWTTGVLFVLNLFALPAMLRGYAEFLLGMAEFQQNPTDWGGYWSAMGAYFGPASLWFLGFIVVIALSRAAFYRAYFFDDLGGTVPLRLGGDELRQGLSYLGWLAAYLVFTVAVYAAVGVITGIVGAILGVAGAPEMLALITIVVLTVVLVIAATVALVWFSIRIAPSGALTALNRRVHILSARKVTQYRFWPLFVGYLVAGIIGYIACYAFMIVAMTIGLSGLDLGEIGAMLSGLDPDASYEALTSALEEPTSRVASAIAILLASVGYAVFILILTGPPAFFTRQWAEASGRTDLENGV